MNFTKAQEDMRLAYISGCTGVLVSGLVWLCSAIVSQYWSLQIAIMVLFFGGMLIHPISTILDKLLKHSGKHSTNNPLGKLAIESTFVLFIGILIALAVAQIKPEWFFLILLLIIGARYFLFSTLYGLSIYWYLGGLLIVIGIMTYQFNFPIHYAIFAGGIIEVLFALIIYKRHQTNH